jgi:hypothetical protein
MGAHWHSVQYIRVQLSIRRRDDSVLKAETCCHVTDSVINKYLLCLTERKEKNFNYVKVK